MMMAWCADKPKMGLAPISPLLGALPWATTALVDMVLLLVDDIDDGDAVGLGDGDDVGYGQCDGDGQDIGVGQGVGAGQGVWYGQYIGHGQDDDDICDGDDGEWKGGCGSGWGGKGVTGGGCGGAGWKVVVVVEVMVERGEGVNGVDGLINTIQK